ncbi:MAG: hypothetical protein GEU88_16645 [Solirubrobacterales bacterium]|nr:hypothetical protein [Solirubrobacterales bacterium]
MSYAIEWMPAAAFLGLVTILCVPYLGFLVGMVLLVVVVLVAAAALVALAGAVIAAPYLLGRSARRRWQAWTAAGRPQSRPARARAAAVDASRPASGRV